MKRKLLFLLTLSLLMPCLSSCDFFDKAKEGFDKFTEDAGNWFDNLGDNIKNTFTNFGQNVVEWWNGVETKTVEIYDDVSSKMVDAYNVTANFVCDTYQKVKDDVISFSTSIVDKFRIKEANRSTSDWEKYSDDQETFVYSQISNNLQKSYSTFAAKVFVPSVNDDVVGIAFTDYSNLYKDANGKEYYGCGFISSVDDFDIDEESVSKGMEILRVDDSNDNKNYFFQYSLENFESHYIRNNQYVKYGINNKKIFFDEEEYNPNSTNINGVSDGLYNFDTKKWIKGDKNENLSVTGNFLDDLIGNDGLIGSTFSLFSQFSFSLCVDEIKTCISNVTTIIRNKINELESNSKILGFNKNDIINNTSSLNMSDVVDVSNNKSIELRASDLNEQTTSSPSSLTKWLIGIGTAAAFILTIVLAIIGQPALCVAFATILGAAIETFLQVVIENKNLTEINWLKVLIGGIAGSLGSLSGNVFYGAAIGSLALTAMNFVDGDSLIRCGVSFVRSFGVSLCFAALFKGLTKLGSKIASHFKKTTLVTADGSTVEKVAGQSLTKTTVDDEIRANIQSDQVTSSLDYKVASDAWNQKMINALPSSSNQNVGICDFSGNFIDKSSINADSTYFIKLKDTASGEILQNAIADGYNVGDTLAEYSNSAIKFSTSMLPDDGFISLTSLTDQTRTQIFSYCDSKLAQTWSNNPSLINSKYLNYFQSKSIDVTNLTVSNISEIRTNFKLTWHEVDGKVVQLVPRWMHQAIRHAGGFSLNKIICALNNYQVFATTVIL